MPSRLHLPRQRSTGFTLIETLIAMTISTALLVAVALAFHASTRAIAVNDAYSRCMQSARLAMGQIITDVRRAEAVKLGADSNTVQIIRPASQMEPGEIYREYRYDAVHQRITIQVFHGDGAGPAYELATGVSDCTFGPAEMGAVDAGAPTVLRLAVRLTCREKEASATLSAAAVTRKSQRY